MKKELSPLERYYNKFDEEHRLSTRHGMVEFETTMRYIRQFAGGGQRKILDIGAGTGRYSVALVAEGHDVTAVEPVSRNLKALEAKHSGAKCWQGDARNLGFLDGGSFDITLLFGPMYHLHSKDERLLAMREAMRVTKRGGLIFSSYIMNEYAVLTYCFRQRNILRVMEEGRLSADFRADTDEDGLFSYLRLQDIDALDAEAGVERVKILAADGAADYMRRELNALDQREFEFFLKYHLATCERPELLGASSHVLDIVRNP